MCQLRQYHQYACRHTSQPCLILTLSAGLHDPRRCMVWDELTLHATTLCATCSKATEQPERTESATTLPRHTPRQTETRVDIAAEPDFDGCQPIAGPPSRSLHGVEERSYRSTAISNNTPPKPRSRGCLQSFASLLALAAKGARPLLHSDRLRFARDQKAHEKECVRHSRHMRDLGGSGNGDAIFGQYANLTAPPPVHRGERARPVPAPAAVSVERRLLSSAPLSPPTSSLLSPSGTVRLEGDHGRLAFRLGSTLRCCNPSLPSPATSAFVR